MPRRSDESEDAAVELPQMPSRPAAAAAPDRELELRRFHVGGVRPRGRAAADSPRPALLTALALGEPAWQRYPLVVSGEDEVTPLADRLEAALREDSDEAVVPLDRLQSLVERVRSALAAGAGATVSCAESLSAALGDGDAVATPTESDETEPDGDATFEGAVRRFAKSLPADALLIDCAATPLLPLHAASLRRRRRPDRLALVAELQAAATRLDGLVRLDDARGPAGRSPGTLSATLGDTGGVFVDAEELARAIGDPRGPLRLDAERRARVGAAHAALHRHAETFCRHEALLFHRGELEIGAVPHGWHIVRAEDPLAAAIERFDSLAQSAVEVYRALRVARLELTNGYVPELHDPLLEALTWRDLTEDELRALPVVAVADAAEQLGGPRLGEFSELLRSGRPLQVLAVEPGPAEAGARPSTGFHSALGDVAVAHRESFVLQASLARPRQLVAGLDRLAASVRPSLVLIAPTPADGAGLDGVTAALYGRSTPCFRYDPARGSSWADRFDVEGNPAEQLLWPRVALDYRDEAGTVQRLDESLTFAHAAATNPVWQADFLPIAHDDWNDAQIDIASYLELPDEERATRLPFVWTLDGARRLGRALLTRRLAFATADRGRGWRVLQELAGIDNVHALRAVGETERAAREEAKRARLEEERERARLLDETRTAVAGETVRRLVATLMGESLDGEAAAAWIEPAAAAGSDAALSPAAAVEGAATAAAPAVEGPYIDSPMCTTCNDCTKINPRMFRYDENDQAYIADATAGSFEQLVRAAEKCPARCIHPGTPRAGDSSATPALLARAAPFN